MAAAVSSAPPAATPDPSATPGAPAKPSLPLLNEVPSSLKQLARLVSRGFYSCEDSLVVDMLVRYPCVREEDLAELLKFDRKMLRAKMGGLIKDKLVQVKQRIETDPEGKVARMNCYYINYRVLVNVVKYKLDHMHKKMETSERDATARSSFVCVACSKTFTDLETDQLFDPQTMDLKCTYCSGEVVEDEAAGPQKDSRQLLAKFNTQMEKLYELLRVVESIRLDPSLLEPDPADIHIKGRDGASATSKGGLARQGPAGEDGRWSGDLTRSGGLRAENQQVNITFGDGQQAAEAKREMPVWMQESTVTNEDSSSNPAPSSSLVMLDEDSSSALEPPSGLAGALPSGPSADAASRLAAGDQTDEITSMLLRHEKRGPGNPLIPSSANNSDSGSDESDADEPVDAAAAAFGRLDPSYSAAAPDGGGSGGGGDDVEDMSDDDDEAGDIPTVTVAGQEVAVTDVDEAAIAKMSADEKERYTQTFQEFYAHVYD